MNEVDLSQDAMDKIERIAVKVAAQTSTTLMAQVAKESAKEAVTEMLLVSGIDTTKPIKNQKNFAYLDDIRLRSESNTRKIQEWSLKAVFVGLLAWTGFNGFK